MLQIRLLGQFDIRLDKRRITITSRVAQSLFAYLALTAGTSHRREKLAGLFWPDTPEENGRKNLRQELWRIRKALSVGQNGADDYLLADEYTVAFNRSSAYWLDVAQLERPDLDLESLTSSLSLYQGELLPGFYEDWIVLERERIQSLFDIRMGQLLERLIESERWTAVQEQAERWLALGNTPEQAFRALMLAYGARGDMAKVSSTYQRCITELKDQLGVEPSPETHAMYEGLIKGSHKAARPAAQPSGTITFLFTDIEGSTNLLDHLGDQYASVLEIHHKIMRNAILKWNGKEVDTQGDAFFVTFTRALDAIQCAAEAQRAFLAQQWPQEKPVRVRMGLHTGEPLIASTGYVGMDVHRAARIGDAAHGGQVLLSQTTRDFVEKEIPPGLSIRDLGEHRLKDLKFPTPLYQLVIDGLPFDFPPVRTKFSGTEAPTPGEPPFKGLQYFDEVDCDLFFGRELLTAKLMDRLQEARFLSVIIGASGSGKSSLVRAGLIPALKRAGRQVLVITPTADPLASLAIELTREAESVTATTQLIDDLMQDPRSLSLFLKRSNTRIQTLLVIDQFEELFTLCRDEFEREAFIDNLLTAIHQSADTFMLVLTLRADFYAHLAQYPELREQVARHQEYIGPMNMEELRRAIEEPARLGHWAFEPGLVDLILRDVGDEPGALPLLSHALLETWKRRAGHTLTLKGYADAGGVHGAIAHTAESVYQTLSLEEQAIARDIFLRLTELGEGTEDTRRRASFDELMSDEDTKDEVRKVLNLLADARLITLGEDTAEVAHEALIREWPTLRNWLNEDREGLQLHRRLTEAAREWEFLERDEDLLYRGAHLAQAREWAMLHPGALNASEKAFVEASNALEQRELIEREAQQRRELEAAQKLAETERQSASRMRIRNRVITAVGVIAILLAMAAFSFSRQSNVNAANAQKNAQSALKAQATSQVEAQSRATAESNAVSERNVAQRQSLIASVRELAGASTLNLDVDPERSILLAMQAIALTDHAGQPPLTEAQDALHRAIQAARVQFTLRGHSGPVGGVAYSPDGKHLATLSTDGTVRVWDSNNGELISTIMIGKLGNLPSNHVARSLSFSPDGTRLAASAADHLAKVWNVATGKELLVLQGHEDEVTAAVFSPDGNWIATSSLDQTARVWDANTGQQAQVLSGQHGPVNSVAFSIDGKYVAAAGDDPGTILWDRETGKPFLTLPAPEGASSVAFNPNGQTVATGGWNGSWNLWDVSTGKKLVTGFGHRTLITDITFNADGSQIATTGEDGTAILWDAASGRELLTLAGHALGTQSVSFSPDGIHLATASSDTTAKIWDISPAGSREWFDLIGHTDRIWWVAYSPDGKYIATAGVEGAAKLWDAQNGRELYSFDDFSDGAWDVSFSPDSKRLVATGGILDGFARIYDTDTGQEVLKVPTSGERMVFSPDGSYLATTTVKRDENGKIIGPVLVKMLDPKTGKELFTLNGGLKDFAQEITFSSDGERLASAGEDGILKVWDVKANRELLTIDAGIHQASVAFSPDGKLLASGGSDAVVRIWDAATGKEVYTLTGHTGPIFGVTFSPDGHYLASASVDSTVKLWDVLDNFTSQPVTLPGHSRAVYRIAFSPDGKRLVTSSRDGTARVYAVDLRDLISLAQSRLTRTWTLDECQKYLHTETCPAAP